ncbi:hypothetical protein I6I92_01425 [Peptoniphilus asaccharolyticus]|nr:hypothetical protein [Peptoniphilus asaccharolyticus]MBL7574537.1 hypothetical protein [Peptoniphilus asaccharolyticus]
MDKILFFFFDNIKLVVRASGFTEEEKIVMKKINPKRYKNGDNLWLIIS